MVTVGKWWNGTWGRLARRDIWLKCDGDLWVVEARKGDGDSKVWRRQFPGDEAGARALVAELLLRPVPGEWQQMSTGQAAGGG